METTSKYGKLNTLVLYPNFAEERIKQLVDKVNIANLKYSPLLEHVENLNNKLNDRDNSLRNSKMEDDQSLYHS